MCYYILYSKDCIAGLKDKNGSECLKVGLSDLDDRWDSYQTHRKKTQTYIRNFQILLSMVETLLN